MSYIENFEYSEPKLLVFYLGGVTETSNIEVHDVIFLVAKNLAEALPEIRKKWYGTQSSLHVDSWFPLENIDGFDVSVVLRAKQKSSIESANKLYFVNLGAYNKGQFGELHFMKFVIANSVNEAKEKAKSLIQQNLELLHKDDIYEVDNCLEISKVESYRIELSRGSKLQLESTNGWLRLPG